MYGRETDISPGLINKRNQAWYLHSFNLLHLKCRLPWEIPWSLIFCVGRLKEPLIQPPSSASIPHHTIMMTHSAALYIICVQIGEWVRINFYKYANTRISNPPPPPSYQHTNVYVEYVHLSVCPTRLMPWGYFRTNSLRRVNIKCAKNNEILDRIVSGASKLPYL